MRRPPLRILAVGSVLTVVAAGCADPGGGGRNGELVTVFAAASLTDAFGELATGFRTTAGGVAVELNVAGSTSLRTQILDGAPADVYASADTSTMAELVGAGVAADPVPFAANRLQVAVPPGNPAGVRGLADFADPQLLLGLCAEEVPCGSLARQALARAGVAPSIDTFEADVRSLLTKVRAGELDAGVVYRSDVLAAGDTVEGIDIPPEVNVTATYPIAVLTEAANPEGGALFMAHVLSSEGQAVLAAHGFAAP